jgi:hypothetical protein
VALTPCYFPYSPMESGIQGRVAEEDISKVSYFLNLVNKVKRGVNLYTGTFLYKQLSYLLFPLNKRKR